MDIMKIIYNEISTLHFCFNFGPQLELMKYSYKGINHVLTINVSDIK